MKKFLKILLYTTVMLISLTAFAGDDDNPDGLPGDPGTPAPIDDYIPLVIVGAASLAFYFLKKKEKPVT